MLSVSNTSEICPLCSGPGRFSYTDPVRGWSYQKCRDCRLIWKDRTQLPSAKEELAHYNTHENRPEDPNYRSFLNQLWAPLKAHISAGAHGLDFGSGPGPTLHLMAQEDGFDCAHYDPFFHKDISALETRYDFITCSETAEHFHEPAKEFEQLAGLLKPGGILGLMTRMHDPKTEFGEWHYRLDPTHVSFYHPDTFKVIGQRFGLQVLETVGNSVVLLRKRL